MRIAKHFFEKENHRMTWNMVKSMIFSALFIWSLAGQSQCSPAQSSLTLTIDLTLDGFPDEDGWKIVETATGIAVDSICFGNYSAGGVFTETICLDTGIVYSLYALDDFGDGLDGGEYRISYTFGSGIDTIGANNFNLAFPHCGAAYSNNEIADSSSFYVTYVAPPACLDPTSLSASNLTPTSADLSWTEQNAATSWHLEVTTAGSGLGSGTRGVVTSNPYTATGLTAGTAYEYYVKSICTPGTDSSTWAGPFTFSTPCNAITTFPYLEDFETAVPPVCWSDNIVSGSANWTQATANGNASISPYGGSNMALFSSSNYNGDAAELISPNFDLTGLTTPNLSFWHTQVDWGGDQDTLGVFYRTSSIGTWTYLTSVTTSVTAWTEVNINLPNPSADYAIMLRARSGYGYGVTVDDFQVREAPACVTPTADSTVNIAGTSADLHWTENGTATEWQIEYGTAGFAQGSGTIVTTTTNSPYNLSGLSAATSYEWYVRSVCGPGPNDTSAWSTVQNFSTSFNAPNGVNCTSGGNGSFVFSDDMETGTGWTGDIGTGNGQWDFPTASPGGNSTGTGPSGPASGTTFAEYEASGINTSTIASLVTPAIDLSSGADEAELSFYMHAFGADIGTLNVGVSSSATGPFTNVFTWSGQFQAAATDPWAHIAVDLTAYLGQTVYVEFSYGAAGTGFEGDLAIDLVQVETCVSCAAPSSLAAANIAPTSADLSWVENGTATTWIIEYGTTGFTPGSGTRDTVTANPYTLSGLMSNTSYDWYVQAACGPNDSSAFFGPNSFTTPCTAFTAPYFNDFESDALDAPPSCWLEYNTYSTSAFVEVENFTGTAAPFAGSQALYIYSWTGFTQGSDTLAAISPQFSDLSAGNKQIRFQGNSDDPTTTLIIGTVSSPSPSATFNPVDTIVFAVADTYQEVIVPFTSANGYNGTDEYIVFAHDLNNTFDYIRIDDFNYEQIPSCPRPTSLSSTPLSPSSASLNWVESGSATTWIVEYGASGFAQGSGTRDTVTSNPYTLTGLMANTTYDWYVQSACGLNDSSAFQGPGSFTTPCNAIAAPFTESFTTNALPSCWNESSVSPNDSWEFGTLVDFGAGSVRPDAFGNTGEYANIDFSDDPDTTAIITPIVDITGLTNPRLTFYYNSQTTSTSFSPFNRLIVDYWNGSSWVNVTVIDTLTTAGWTKYEFSAAGYAFNTNFVQFRFAAQEGGAAIGGTGTFTFDQDLMLDEVVVEDTPPCLTPSTLAAANLTTNSADLSWVENNAATSWEVSYGPAGFTPGNGTEVVVTTNPYTLSGLMDNTTYDWSVRSICGNNDTSAWAAQASFTTAFAPCPSLSSAATLPFVERWESASGTFLSIGNIVCASDYTWTFNSNDPLGRVRYGTDAVLASAGSGAVTLDRQSSGVVAANELILTIEMSAYNTATDLELLFDYSNHGEESHAGDSVWVRGSDTDPWVGIYDLYANRPATGTYLAVGPLDVDAALTAAGQAPSASFQVKFGQEDNFPATSPTVSDGFSFDNITLRETPSCYAPINLTTSVITTTSADFSWTDTMTTTAPEYEYSYGAPGFTPGNGTELVVTTDSVTVSGLTSSTNYDWYVRAICGNNDTSLWSSTVSFTTLCTPFAAPFTESFDNTTQPTCWSQSAIQGGPWTFTGPGFGWNTQACTFVPTDHTGNSGSFAALDFSVPDAGVVLEMPDVNVSSLTAPYLEFYYVQCNSLTPNNELFIEAFNGTTWDSVTVIQRGTNGWERFGFQVGAFTYSTNLVKLRFRAEDGGGTQFWGDMALDDISIIETPGTELEASLVVAPNSGCSLTATETVSLSITNNGSAAQTGFSVGYSLNGTAITPETYTATIAPGATATYNFTTTADLSVAGVYDIVAYVDLTGDIDNSNDTASATVISSSVVSAFPYAESFESGAAGWLVEGNAAWELGAPIGTIIDTASDGTQAWVTDLDANYPNSATGFVNSPCLDFTSVPNPYIEMDIWWDIETSWDGAVLQASTDNGVTWQKVGDFGDPNNWYNDNTIGALTAIEPSEEGWTGTGTSGSGAWVTAGHELDGLGGIANVKLRVAFASDGTVNDEGMAFDNVHVFDSVPPLPYYAIGTINTEDATTGVADSLNVECATSGTVIGFDRRGGGYEFAIVDLSSGSQEGITVFEFSDLPNYTTPTAGDSIMLYGEVDQFRGLTQFRPDSIVVLKTNATLPAPLVSTNLDETTESKWLSFPDKYVLLSASQGGSFNIDMVSVLNPTDTVRMRIDSDSDIDDSLAISTNAWAAGDTICGMIGVGGQFDFNSPFLDSYQVFPNSWSDITICRNTVGIDEAEVEDFGGLSIYPNPTNGEFTIQTSGLKASNALLQVRDVSGRVVLEDNIAQSNQAFTRNYNLNDPAKGLYFITLIDGDEQKTFKLIVQ